MKFEATHMNQGVLVLGQVRLKVGCECRNDVHKRLPRPRHVQCLFRRNLTDTAGGLLKIEWINIDENKEAKELCDRMPRHTMMESPYKAT